MEKLIPFILASAGFTWLVVYSKLFLKLRVGVSKKTNNGGVLINVLNDILNCEGCFGFYSGCINYLLVYKTVSIDIIIYGFTGSFVSLFLIKKIQ